ncbi:hypothetical protein [Desulfosporosinus acididurans]|uniref:hypothetical protein n=1 Tax=Desulfosporosinus acididurans TaxID=476652 RepID=UPI000649AD04|nr:hypothetical protein [Desulfosporosinus acididurans]
MRSSRQIRALNSDASGQGARPMRHPCRKAGGKRPVSRPTEEREFKAEFGCDSCRGFTTYNRGSLGFVI